MQEQTSGGVQFLLKSAGANPVRQGVAAALPPLRGEGFSQSLSQASSQFDAAPASMPMPGRSGLPSSVQGTEIKTDPKAAATGPVAAIVAASPETTVVDGAAAEAAMTSMAAAHSPSAKATVGQAAALMVAATDQPVEGTAAQAESTEPVKTLQKPDPDRQASDAESISGLPMSGDLQSGVDVAAQIPVAVTSATATAEVGAPVDSGEISSAAVSTRSVADRVPGSATTSHLAAKGAFADTAGGPSMRPGSTQVALSGAPVSATDTSDGARVGIEADASSRAQSVQLPHAAASVVSSTVAGGPAVTAGASQEALTARAGSASAPTLANAEPALAPVKPAIPVGNDPASAVAAAQMRQGEGGRFGVRVTRSTGTTDADQAGPAVSIVRPTTASAAAQLTTATSAGTGTGSSSGLEVAVTASAAAARIAQLGQHAVATGEAGGTGGRLTAESAQGADNAEQLSDAAVAEELEEAATLRLREQVRDGLLADARQQGRLADRMALEPAVSGAVRDSGSATTVTPESLMASARGQLIPTPGSVAPAGVPVAGADAAAPQSSASAPFSVPLLGAQPQQALAENVRWMINGSIGAAEINLAPAGMGPVSVKLNADKNGLNVSIVAPHGVTRDALEGLIPRLREQLQLQGHAQVDVSVSDRREAPADSRQQMYQQGSGQSSGQTGGQASGQGGGQTNGQTNGQPGQNNGDSRGGSDQRDRQGSQAGPVLAEETGIGTRQGVQSNHHQGAASRYDLYV